jgi:hypothetical protein
MTATRTFLVHASAALVAVSSARADLGEDRCTVYTCGGNSAELYGIPLKGLRIDGVANPEGVRIVRNSFRVPSTAPPSCYGTVRQLGIVRGELIGVDAAGVPVCGPDDVKGGWFHVAVSRAAPGRPGAANARTSTVPVWIDDVITLETWERDPALRSRVRAYRFTLAAPGARSQRSICTLPKATWIDAWSIAHGGASPPSVPDPTTKAGYALLVQGERYENDGSSELRGPPWFNIACAGNAIAKLRLLGFDPTTPQPGTASDRPSGPDERAATLKMLTAQYRGPERYTSQGMPLVWLSHRGIRYAWVPPVDDPAVGPIEAQWTGAGASCLSHMRRWRRESSQGLRLSFAGNREQDEVAAIRASAAGTGAVLPACAGTAAVDLATSLTGATSGPPYWTTYTMDHISHQRSTGVVARRLPASP